MNTFRFQVPSTVPTQAIGDTSDSTPHEWLIWWSARYRHEEGDDVAYADLIGKHIAFSSEHFRDIGKWKDNAYAETKWKPNVASVAYVIWEQAAEELPTCPEETKVAAFLADWSNRTYTDKFSSGPVMKRFGLSRATTLLHFVSGGRYPIFDSRVKTAIAALLERPELPYTLGAYMDSCLPLANELKECCRAKNIRTLDEALFSYGRFRTTTSRPRRPRRSSVTPVVADMAKATASKVHLYAILIDGVELAGEPRIWDKVHYDAQALAAVGRDVKILWKSGPANDGGETGKTWAPAKARSARVASLKAAGELLLNAIA